MEVEEGKSEPTGIGRKLEDKRMQIFEQKKRRTFMCTSLLKCSA